jgi:O-antigen/teichoic acid export membrane protein
VSFRKIAQKNFWWLVLDRIGEQLSRTILFLILARLLSPDDFGLLAIIMVVNSFSLVLIDGGLGQALIRKSRISDSDISTVFIFMSFLSIFLYGVIFSISHHIAEFYNIKELTQYIRISSLIVLTYGFLVVQRAVLMQRNDFRKLAMAKMPAILISGAFAIFLAFKGAGVWSLIAQILSFSVINVLIIWFLNPIKLQLDFNVNAFREFWRFSSRLLMSGLISVTNREAIKMVIGRIYSQHELGLYSQARRIQQLLSDRIVSAVQTATYPLLSQANNNMLRLRRGYVDTLKVTSTIIFPLMIFLHTSSGSIVEIVLGRNWVGVVPILKLLSFVGLTAHINSINVNLLKVIGRTDLVLRISWMKFLVLIMGLSSVIYESFQIFILMQVAVTVINTCINMVYTAKLIQYNLINQVFDVAIVFVQFSPMAIVLWWLDRVGEIPGWSLFYQIIGGLILGVLPIVTIDIASNKYIINMFLRNIRNKPNIK